MASAVSGCTDFHSIHGLHLLYAIAEHPCSGGPDGGALGFHMGSRGVNKAELIKGRGVAHFREDTKS